jgi:hypothetical protein
LTAIKNGNRVSFRSLKGIKGNLEELGMDYSLLLNNCKNK